ncbi:cytochrome c3 family protein, partial [Novosphingobium aquae]
ANVTGTCASCHNGTSATGKSATHIATNTNCQDCHTTTAWSPAKTVNHNDVIGTCSSCHNGTKASGKPATHVPTTAECSTCHSTTGWTPANFSH